MVQISTVVSLLITAAARVTSGESHFSDVERIDSLALVLCLSIRTLSIIEGNLCSTSSPSAARSYYIADPVSGGMHTNH